MNKQRLKILNDLGFRSYSAYMRSRLWRSIRDLVFEYRGKSCCCCTAEAESVHHESYDYATMVGRKLDHLYPICRECHDTVENSARKIDHFIRSDFDRTIKGYDASALEAAIEARKKKKLSKRKGVEMKRLVYCEQCHGSGWIDSSNQDLCLACNGSGEPQSLDEAVTPNWLDSQDWLKKQDDTGHFKSWIAFDGPMTRRRLEVFWHAASDDIAEWSTLYIGRDVKHSNPTIRQVVAFKQAFELISNDKF